MKVFWQRPRVHKFTTACEFVEEFKIGEGDFILSSSSVYRKYFEGLVSGAVVHFKSEYGSGEPTDTMIDQLIEDFNKTECSRIIAIGGGAVIDMAKLLVLDGMAPAADYYQRKVSPVKVRPLIAVPTTCGAGSESSNVTIAEITTLNTKLGLAVDELFPDEAVLIPELLTELPYSFFATSAIDALIHAVESWVSPKASIYTEMFSRKAAEMILSGFKMIAGNGPEYRFRLLEEFLVASDMAGIAFGNAGTGAVHAMSYPLSGVYHVTHGEANYQFLTAVFRKYNELAPNGKINELNGFFAEVLGCSVHEVYNELERLLGSMIARKPLREYGMKEEEIKEFPETVFENQQRLLNQSYIKFSKRQMEEIYQELF